MERNRRSAHNATAKAVEQQRKTMKPNKRRASEENNVYPNDDLLTPMFERFVANPNNTKQRRICIKEEPCSLSNGPTGSDAVFFRWTPDSIEMMLNLRFDMEEQFNQRLRQKKELWNEIAMEMGRRGGYVLSGEVCDLKFRNMLQTYKKNRLKEERGQQDLIVWEYYAAFKESCTSFNDMVTNTGEDGNEQLLPSLLCESVCGETQQGDESSSRAHSQLAELANSTESQQEAPMQTLKMPKGMGSSAQAHNKRQRMASTPQQDIKNVPQEHLALDTSNSAMYPDSQRLDLNNTANLSTTSTQTEQGTGPVPPPPPPVLKSIASMVEAVASTNVNAPASFAVPANIALSTTLPSALSTAFPTIDIRAATPASATASLQGVEVRECELFGELVGLQMMSVHDASTRALLKFKIQELIYLANMGRLASSNVNSRH